MSGRCAKVVRRLLLRMRRFEGAMANCGRDCSWHVAERRWPSAKICTTDAQSGTTPDGGERQIRADETFDIAIVGGGITGAIIALTPTADGHEVAVVDRRVPGEGSTIASTAMIQFEFDTPLIHLAKKIGKQNAERAYIRSARAVEDLRNLIKSNSLASH